MQQPHYKPPWIDRIRFIGKYYISGCEAPIGIYAEMAQPAAKRIALVFTTLSVAEIVKEFFRPRGLRSRRHGRKGRKSRGYRGGIPDPNELIGDRLPGKYDYWNRSYGLGTRIFYVVDDVIDRVLWTAFLLEMADDLVYSTLLGVMEWNPDKCANIRRMWRRGGYRVEGGAGPVWEPVEAGPTIYNYGINSPQSSLFFLPEGTFTCTFGAKLQAPSGQRKVTLRFRQIEAPYAVYAETPEIDVLTSENTDAVLQATITGPTGVVIEGKEDGGFWDINFCDLSVLEIL